MVQQLQSNKVWLEDWDPSFLEALSPEDTEQNAGRDWRDLYALLPDDWERPSAKGSNSDEAGRGGQESGDERSQGGDRDSRGDEDEEESDEVRKRHLDFAFTDSRRSFRTRLDVTSVTRVAISASV